MISSFFHDPFSVRSFRPAKCRPDGLSLRFRQLQTTPRSYLFSPLNRANGQLYSITLEKPLGLIIEEDKKKGRARIVEIVPNSQAAQLASKAKLDPSVSASAPAVGDVLRGLTTTVVTWGEGALIAQTPQREIVVFGCDNQKFRDVSVAMKRGLKSDGRVTVVLERECSQALT